MIEKSGCIENYIYCVSVMYKTKSEHNHIKIILKSVAHSSVPQKGLGWGGCGSNHRYCLPHSRIKETNKRRTTNE